MGQGIYRVVGFGCLNPPPFDWDHDDRPCLHNVLETSYECEPSYAMVPFGVDDGFLQDWEGLPSLPEGLPHVADRTAVYADISVPLRIAHLWEFIRTIAVSRGWELPPGRVIFASDWD